MNEIYIFDSKSTQMPLQKAQIPHSIRESTILSSDEIDKLCAIDVLPELSEVNVFAEEPEVSAIMEYFVDQPDEQLVELHKLAKLYLGENEIEKAWKTLMQV